MSERRARKMFFVRRMIRLFGFVEEPLMSLLPTSAKAQCQDLCRTRRERVKVPEKDGKRRGRGMQFFSKGRNNLANLE